MTVKEAETPYIGAIFEVLGKTTNHVRYIHTYMAAGNLTSEQGSKMKQAWAADFFGKGRNPVTMFLFQVSRVAMFTKYHSHSCSS